MECVQDLVLSHCRGVVVEPLKAYSQQPECSHECAQEPPERTRARKFARKSKAQGTEQSDQDHDVEPVHIEALLQKDRHVNKSFSYTELSRQKEIDEHDARLNPSGYPHQLSNG